MKQNKIGSKWATSNGTISLCYFISLNTFNFKIKNKIPISLYKMNIELNKKIIYKKTKQNFVPKHVNDVNAFLNI